MEFTTEGILERLKSDLKNDTSKIEGSFTMDNLQAVSEELARFYSMLIVPIKEEIADRKDEVSTSGNERHYVQWAKEVTDASGKKVIGNARAYGVRDGSGVVYLALISVNADVPDEATVQLVKDYIQLQRPVGAMPIIAAAQGIPIRIYASVELKDGYDVANVTPAAKAAIQAYFVEIAFKKKATALNYARIGSIINGIDGIADIDDDYTVNEERESIPADYDEYFVLEELILNGSE